MNRFWTVFKTHKFNIIGMIHVKALPGTPKYAGNWPEIIEAAQHEAHLYSRHKVFSGKDAVLIENMHDLPYVRDSCIGPETVACMVRLATAVRQIVPQHMPCGIQVLASGNRQALAVTKASDLQFIRAEGFVFGHVADEGYTDACAGQLLRFRRLIDADDVLIFTDLKKKHSAHAITHDVSLLETAKAAQFFLTDGIVITGNSTGHAASKQELGEVAGKIKVPLLIGSGVTIDNAVDYYAQAHAAIIGSHFKTNGIWENELCEKSIERFMCKIWKLREHEVRPTQ